MRGTLLVGLVMTLMSVPVAGAQPQRARDRVQPPNRGQLEQRLRERLATVVQRELALNDEQMRRLSEVNQRYESRRMELVRREREARLSMRRELMGDTAPNDDRVAQLLLESSRIQRERLDLIDSEQNDLAKFLTPVQRAKYLGIQEQMRRRIEDMRPRPPFVDEQGTGRGRPGPGRGRRPPNQPH